MSPFLGLARARSFRLLDPLFRIDAEDQPHRHFVAACQLHNYIRDLPRIAFRTPFEASQHLEHRTDRCLVVRQQVRRILARTPCPVGSNTSRLQRADLDPERRYFHCQRIAETAHGPLGRVIRRITGNREATTDRGHLKDVTAPPLAHHWHGRSCCVHHAVEACVHHSLEVLRTHLLERRKLPITGIVDQHIQPSESVHRQLHGCLCGGLITHFQRNGLHPLAVLHHQRCQFLRPARSGYHAVTCGQRCLGDVPPQPVSASRNQPDLHRLLLRHHICSFALFCQCDYSLIYEMQRLVTWLCRPKTFESRYPGILSLWMGSTSQGLSSPLPRLLTTSRLVPPGDHSERPAAQSRHESWFGTRRMARHRRL